MIMKPLSYPSPNYNERAIGKQISWIIIHYTDMQNAEAALKHLSNPESKVSAHYLISKTGEIYQMVADEKRAWHAGQGYWRGETDLNSVSLGIELDNPGHTLGPKPYSDSQLSSLLILLDKLCLDHLIPASNIIGHSDLAPTRKMDPGEHFPWQWLQEQGYGIPLAPTPQRPIATSPLEMQHQLRELGYDCPLSNTLDPVTVSIITAFQRHFTPTKVTGTITSDLLNALAQVNLNQDV